MYDGRDLTQIFATEIASFPSPWHWIQNRINNRNYEGMYHGDFIPLTVNGETLDMQININTYKGTTDQNLDDHIDFISRDCYSQAVQWNANNTNNGTAEQPCPYLASDVKQFLDQLYNELPQEVRNVIVNKRTISEQRYSASGVLTNSTSWSSVDLGKLWLLTEYEVFGSVIRGTKFYSAGQAVQYPIFANNWKYRIKRVGSGGLKSYWWLMSVGNDSPTFVCAVHDTGICSGGNAESFLNVPICFRIIRQIQS